MRSDRGFASAILLALVALVGLWCLALVDAAFVLVAAQRARTAADAAALAAAADQWRLAGGSDPAGAARRVAEANGAVLESCECAMRGAVARVTVSVATRVRMLRAAARVHATAAARADPGALFRPP